MLKNIRCGCIGSGKMAEAIISGLLKEKIVDPSQIMATGPRKERGAELAGKYAIGVDTNNLAAAKVDILVLAVKPQTMKRVLEEIKGHIPTHALIVSIAAGVTLRTLSTGLDTEQIVRAMPNTPGRINRGITVWTATASVTEEQKKQASIVLRALGEEVFVEEEKYLDMATALSGTGPAYVFLFMEALVDAGVRMGLPRYLAERLVLETVAGSAEYAKRAGEHLAQLRNDVTSPGGTSAEALYKLDEMGFRTAVMNAVHAAYMRSLELGKGQ